MRSKQVSLTSSLLYHQGMIAPVIRVAALDDLPGLLELYQHLHPEDSLPDLAHAKAAWLALLATGINSVVVADKAGVLISSCALAIVPNMSRGARPYGVIENVVTHPDHRRVGLGRAVLHAALDIGWRAGCYKVSLATGSQRQATLRFYEGAGFHQGRKTHFEIRSS